MAGTTAHAYYIHITVANNSGHTLTSLKIQGGISVSLLSAKPTYLLDSSSTGYSAGHACGGLVAINTSKNSNVVTLSGGSLADGASCDLVVSATNILFGTSAGHDASITGTWSASAKYLTTTYSAGPTGRLMVHVV